MPPGDARQGASVGVNDPKPYLSPTELSALIPYSEQSLRVMRSHGEHREGVHWFRRGRRVIYKWAAICEWIESTAPVVPRSASNDIVPLSRGGRMN
jgi:hypothetical protein